LIQTIGRAARHISGKAILYADKITGSMQRAIDETDRRREKQRAFNTAHGIIPQGINKAIHDILEGTTSAAEATKSRAMLKVAEETAAYNLKLTPIQIAKKIKQLEQRMYQHAKDLEFEEAAKVRDELHALEKQLVGI
jgi:excinuclease ABC subunit B